MNREQKLAEALAKIITNPGIQLPVVERIQAAEALASEPGQEPAPLASGITRENGGVVIVNAGALQMIRNALKRDAEEGKQSRAEMLAELDRATRTAPQPVALVPLTIREVSDQMNASEFARHCCNSYWPAQFARAIERALAAKNGMPLAGGEG